MKKTNLRLNNFFILENKNKYFLTDIDQLDDWVDFNQKKLKEFLKKDITQQINDLLKEHSVSSNVNFITNDLKEMEGGDKLPLKIIHLDVKSGG